VKLGGSLLVAESPAGKKQLRDALKQQFLLIVTPQRAVRTVAAVYSDPRAGDKGEAARTATEAALNAATAAEPEPGTAAAALLKAEREARAKETAELRQQIVALQRDLEKLRAATETKLITREYALKHRKAREVAADLSDLVKDSANKDRFQLTVDAGHNSIIIHVVEKFAGEFDKVIAALDRPERLLDPNDPDDAYATQIKRILAERRKERADLGTEKLLSTRNALAPTNRNNSTHSAEVRLLELDLAEAQLALDRAEKESARIEQLRATNAISQEQVDQKRFELAQAKIQVQRATAKLQAGSPAVESRATAEPVGPSQRTEIRLLELDLADAKLAVEEAESELARVQQIQKQSPAALSEQEIRKYQFQADRAKIQVQRIMIKLEAAKTEPQPARR